MTSSSYRAFSDTPPDDIPLVRRAFERIARIKCNLEDGLEPEVDIKLDFSDEKFEKLRDLCLSVQYSRTWHDFVAVSARKMALALSGTKPDHAMMLRWRFMQAAQRNAFLGDLAEMQAGMFSGRHLRFFPTSIRSDPAKTAGAFNFTVKDLSDASGTYVTFKDIEKMSYAAAVKCGWHEQLHGFHFQLASALHRGIIRPGHPFYDDAVLMKEKVVNLAHIPARYPAPIYRADVDERLCYNSQDEFYAAYAQNSSQHALLSIRCAV